MKKNGVILVKFVEEHYRLLIQSNIFTVEDNIQISILLK